MNQGNLSRSSSSSSNKGQKQAAPARQTYDQAFPSLGGPKAPAPTPAPAPSRGWESKETTTMDKKVRSEKSAESLKDSLQKAMGLSGPEFPEVRRWDGDKAIAWAGARKSVDRDAIKRLATSFYTYIRIQFGKAFGLQADEDTDYDDCPRTVCVLWVPDSPGSTKGMVYLASGIRASGRDPVTNRPSYGPNTVLYGPLEKQVGASTRHRRDYACAEMHAVNFAMQNRAGALPAGTMQCTFGLPDVDDVGSKGGKAYMKPCKVDKTGIGCDDVLTKLGIDTVA